MSTEKIYLLNASSTQSSTVDAADDNNEIYDLNRSLSRSPSALWKDSRRSLDWIGGVFATVALAQLSTNLFQRVGEYK